MGFPSRTSSLPACPASFPAFLPFPPVLPCGWLHGHDIELLVVKVFVGFDGHVAAERLA
jgi:hypothetical protein